MVITFQKRHCLFDAVNGFLRVGLAACEFQFDYKVVPVVPGKF